MRLHRLFLLNAVLAVLGITLAAEPARDTLVSVTPSDAVISDSSRLIVRIERRNIQARAIHDTLDITLQAVDYPIAGFDLTFGTSSPHLNIIEILPGDMPTVCNWEYFTSRQINTGGRADYPLTMWKAIGLAEMMPDTLVERCYTYNGEVSLARMVVSNSHVLQMPETTAAIYFFWQDCTDNAISSASGQKLLLSLSVLDYLEPPVLDSAVEFPTRRGHPRRCINPASPNKPVRLIEFHNGGVTFSYAVSAKPDSVPQVDSLQSQ